MRVTKILTKILRSTSALLQSNLQQKADKTNIDGNERKGWFFYKRFMGEKVRHLTSGLSSYALTMLDKSNLVGKIACITFSCAHIWRVWFLLTLGWESIVTLPGLFLTSAFLGDFRRHARGRGGIGITWQLGAVKTSFSIRVTKWKTNPALTYIRGNLEISEAKNPPIWGDEVEAAAASEVFLGGFFSSIIGGAGALMTRDSFL